MLKLICSGEEFFREIILLIRGAKNSIVLQTYILEDDPSGTPVLEALEEAAMRGIQIQMMLDGFGSGALSPVWVSRLRCAGIDFRFFGTVISPETWNPGRRLHHKIMVVDDAKMIIGGINIAEKYHGTEKEAAWLDYAVYHEGYAALVAAHWCRRLFGKQFYRTAYFSSVSAASTHLLINDAFRNKVQILRAYRRAILKAQKEVIIFSPYFLPGIRMRAALISAAKRGVKVMLCLPGRPDVPIIYKASTYLYPMLLKAGVEIYEWNDSVMHAKVAVVDEAWSTLGSFNLNNLSALMSIEANLEITDADFCRSLHQELNAVLQRAHRVNPVLWQQDLGFFKKLSHLIAYYTLKTTERFLRFFPLFGTKPRTQGE